MSAKRQAAVGMSGGVDSTAAAAVLKDRGWDVLGFTLRIYQGESTCCGLEDVKQAEKAAWKLGIDHYILDAADIFNREVVGPFINDYVTGYTPSPCVICNEKIKFGFMLEKARALGCDAVATGHYAKVYRTGRHYALYRGEATGRDQSYFLHRLTQEQLASTLLPLGEFKSKNEVESFLCKRLEIDHRRGESQDICFVPEGAYAEFIESHTGDVPGGGDIVDSSGRRLGTHSGIHRYTIGQRRGLGIAHTEPLYVISLIPSTNTVVVGPRREAMGDQLTVENVHWISGRPAGRSFRCLAQLRYRHKAVSAQVRSLDQNRFHVTLDNPQFGITPGQAAVFYDNNRVLGGGWIAKGERIDPCPPARSPTA